MELTDIICTGHQALRYADALVDACGTLRQRFLGNSFATHVHETCTRPTGLHARAHLAMGSCQFRQLQFQGK